MSEERKIEKFGVGYLYPDRNPPEFHFFRSECIEVDMSDGVKVNPSPSLISTSIHSLLKK